MDLLQQVNFHFVSVNAAETRWVSIQFCGTMQPAEVPPPQGGSFFAQNQYGVEMPEKKNAPEDVEEELPQVTNLDTTRVEFVEAELVRMHQSAAQEIKADEVDLQQSAAFDVDTSRISAHEAALGFINANEVELTNSAAGAIRATNVNVIGQAGFIAADTVNLGNTYAGVVAANDVRGERIETLILLGSHIEGNVQTVIDTRSALIAGMVGGLMTGIIMLIGRLVFGRKS